MSELNMDWQVGDSVRCVGSGCTGQLLKKDTVYKISRLRGTQYLEVDGVFGLWDRDRFEIVGIAADPNPEPAVVAEPNPYDDWKSGDSVRCLNADASWGLLAAEHVYEIDGNPVLDANCGPGIYLVGIPSHEWDCNRFERVAPIVDVHSEPDKRAEQSDVELISADEARRLADEHFMANGLELRLAIKAAIAAAVAKGESIAHVHISDSVFPAAVRWISKRGYSMSMVPGFTRGTISWV